MGPTVGDVVGGREGLAVRFGATASSVAEGPSLNSCRKSSELMDITGHLWQPQGGPGPRRRPSYDRAATASHCSPARVRGAR